jgi:hypothetical protein
MVHNIKLKTLLNRRLKLITNQIITYQIRNRSKEQLRDTTITQQKLPLIHLMQSQHNEPKDTINKKSVLTTY